MKIPRPPLPLKPGDPIGIIAPGGRLSDMSRFHSGLAVLRDMGLQPVFPHDLWPGEEYLADTDDNRALEFNRLFRAPEIKALIALRGGYGCLRLLDKLDYDLTGVHAKMIIGFSDITLLQNDLYQKTGLISLHGPVLTSLCDLSPTAWERFSLCLGGRWDEPVVDKKIEILRTGPCHAAPLIGGNLASLLSLLGTPFDFSWDNALLFLEDINEPAYRVDRMLTQLALAGKFDKLSGLILGNFSGVFPENSGQQLSYLETIWQRILVLCKKTDFPIWGNFSSGHTPNNLTLPLGALTKMESGNGTLSFPDGRTRYMI
jgi:muramoyltetrapeptide carboxypeptidase